jgi:hypothetical protein
MELVSTIRLSMPKMFYNKRMQLKIKSRAELRAFVMMSSMKDARNNPKKLEEIMEIYYKLLSETLTAGVQTGKDYIDGR